MKEKKYTYTFLYPPNKMTISKDGEIIEMPSENYIIKGNSVTFKKDPEDYFPSKNK